MNSNHEPDGTGTRGPLGPSSTPGPGGSWRGRVVVAAAAAGPPPLLHRSAEDPVEFRPVAGAPGRWSVDLVLPAGTRLTYGVEVDGVVLADPANPVAAGPTRSVLAVPDAAQDPLLDPLWPVRGPDDALPLPREKVRWTSAALGRRRTVRVARAPGAVALVVLLDGDVWLHQHPAAEAFAAARAAGLLPPVDLAFVPAGEAADRERDLGVRREEHARALREELLPLLGAAGRTVVLAGQSLGGLAALHAAVRCPAAFPRVVATSGSFWWPAAAGAPLSGPAGGELADLVRRSADLGALDVHLDVGQDEPGVRRHVDAVADALRGRGARVTATRGPGGHDPLRWRAPLLRGVGRALGHEPPHRATSPA